jgi:hypothetical protein
LRSGFAGEAHKENSHDNYGKKAAHVLKIQIKISLTKRQANYKKRCLERLKV